MPRSGCAGAVELLQRERWAADLAVAEAADRPPETDRDPVIVELGDDRDLVAQVPRADAGVEHDGVADAELSDRGRRTNRMQQLAPRIDRIGDRADPP